MSFKYKLTFHDEPYTTTFAIFVIFIAGIKPETLVVPDGRAASLDKCTDTVKDPAVPEDME